jgi:hypothetical protein
MLDLLRVFLIILLSLSVFVTPGLCIIEGFLHGFTISTILTSVILCLTQITLIISLCAARKVKTLVIFLIITSGLFLNLKKQD